MPGVTISAPAGNAARSGAASMPAACAEWSDHSAPRPAVAIDPAFLETLPRREFRAGLYEVIKYGVIASRPLFDRVATSLKTLFARDHNALIPVIKESCDIKAAVVDEDEVGALLARAGEQLGVGADAGHDGIDLVATGYL